MVCKVDVEGEEAAVIQGAAPMIAQGSILLALSAYHRPADLWGLARQVDAINPDYRFALRSHGCDGSDSMIYAMPPGP